MKSFLIFVCFATFFSSPKSKQELCSVEAAFDGYVQGVYYFVDIEGTCYEFQGMEPQAKEKYDLANGNYEGTRFTVAYRIEVETYDDDGEAQEYENQIIVDLEIIG